MIKGHHSLLLRKLFSTSKKHNKTTTVCPRKIINSSKISPVKCYSTEKDNCACKRRRKDIDKIKDLTLQLTENIN